ncbi:MAG: hypothetical protein WBD36_13725 [Bacteroidota bacterium]
MFPRFGVAFIIFSSLLFPTETRSQQTNLSIAPAIDSLMERLIGNPNNPDLESRIIDAYLQSVNPELALLEISYAEALNQLGSEGVQMKGRVQAGLEQIQPALKTLQLAYLQAPRDESLLLISILEYARGQKERGNDQLQRLSSRIPGLSAQLLQQYEKFYLNGRTAVARGIADAMKDLDPVSYETYFPHPQISLLSPADNFSTEASQTSVIFEVKHVRPVKTIKLGGKNVYDRGDEPVQSVDENFFKSFSELVPLSEGKNSIPVSAVDVFGFESVVPLTINGINFNRVAGWSSPMSDSLGQQFRSLRSYIPEPELLVRKSSAYRVLVISGGGNDSLTRVDRGLLMYDAMTHAYSGLANPANAKILLGQRVSSQNISLITSDWLVKSATFQSVTLIFLSGAWTISPGQWMLQDSYGQQVNFKPILEQLGQVATAGVVVVIDGSIDRRTDFEAGLRNIVAASTIPIQILLTPEGTTWPSGLVRALAVVDTSVDPRIGTDLFSLTQVSSKIGGTVISKEASAGIVLLRSPALKMRQAYDRMLVQLDEQLSNQRSSPAIKKKIMDFCKDWRRYNEVSRFLSAQLSLADFIVRADEFLSRTTESGLETK